MLALGVVRAADLSAQDTQRRPAAAPRCRTSALRREPLRVEGGRRLYVEPSALVGSGEETLLAGTPTYLWRRDRRGMLPELERRDSLVGAVIPRRGNAKGVTAPLPGRPLRFVRAGERARGAWTIAFAELDEAVRNPADERVLKLWSGDHDGRRWSNLAPLPIPPGWTPQTLEPTPVATKGDSMVWAFPAQSQDRRDGLIVFTRAGGTWRADTLVTPGFSGTGAAYVEGLGFALVVAQFDYRSPGARPSVALYARSPDWREIARLTGPGEMRLRDPSITAGGSRPPATGWMTLETDEVTTRQSLRVRLGALSLGAAAPALTFDSSAVDYALQQRADGWVFALVHHMQARPEERPALRLAAASPRSEPQLLFDIPTPFTGGFALRAAGTDLLIAGAAMGTTEREPFITTLLLRTHITCDDAGK